MKHGGAVGIKEFVLDESKSVDDAPEEERILAVEYSEKGDDKWVWEYAEHNPLGNTGPSELASTGTPDASDPSGLPAALELDLPVVSVPGDRYPLIDYAGLEVTLTDPNPAGVSELFYSLVPGVWERYLSPIPIDPGMTLETHAVTIDPDHWADSETTHDEFSTDPVKLEVDLGFAQLSYDYVSLGGALEPGSYSDAPLAMPGKVSLPNSASIPLEYSNATVFNIYWTLDGSDPSAPGAEGGADFSAGFNGQEIPVSPDDWGSSDSLEVNVYAKSHQASIATDSELVTATLTVARLPLRAPLVEIDPAADTLTLALQSDFGDTPIGSRIFYTTDGSDPGIGSDGGPVAGTLYVGPISSTNVLNLNARVYPPPLYQQWFHTSEMASYAAVVEPSDEPGPDVVVAVTVSTGP